MDDIQEVHDWAKRKLDKAERRNRMGELMVKHFQEVRTQVVPAILAGPDAQLRESTLKLEKSIEDLPAKLAARAEEHQQDLAQAKQRTQLLQEWLQELS